MRILAGIVSLLLAVGYSPPSPAAEWYYVVDANRGTTNGPFQLRDGDGIQIGSNQYQIVQAPPLFDIAKRTVAEVYALQALPESVLRKAWSDAKAPTNQPLPELLFLNMDTNVHVTLRLQQVDIADVLRYVCEVADLRASRFQLWTGRLQEVLVVEPATMHDDRETQVYYVRSAFYDLMIKAHCASLKEWLMQLGAFQKESEAQVQYLPAKNWLIIRAPHEVQESCSRTLQ